MMSAEGGYYHWVKQAMGPFAGFMAGWMNWVVAWVDVSIYPVLAAYYLGYFIPIIRTGGEIGGIFFSSEVLSFIVALILIWSISYLNIRGKATGHITNCLAVYLPRWQYLCAGIIIWVPPTSIHCTHPRRFSSIVGSLTQASSLPCGILWMELPTLL
jgi:amino acid transporter